MKDFLKSKRVLLGIVFVVMLAGGLNAYAAQDMPSISVLVSNIKIFVGSSNYNIKDSVGKDIKVFNEEGVTYAPIRAIGEALGKDVVWDAENNKIVLEDTKEVGEFFSFEEFKITKFPLIATIPEKNIQLYGINPRGVVLYKNGVGQLFDWAYLTPRGILPKIAEEDFNNDGNDEIGVSLYWGSGTGISIEQLHVLETAKDRFDNDYYLDHEFMEVDYLAQLKEILQYKYNPDNKKLTIQIRDKSYEFQCDGDFEALHYFSMVSFNFENDRIRAIFPIGIKYANSYVFEYKLGALITEVIYENGEFTLVEPELCEKYDFPM